MNNDNENAKKGRGGNKDGKPSFSLLECLRREEWRMFEAFLETDAVKLPSRKAKELVVFLRKEVERGSDWESIEAKALSQFFDGNRNNLSGHISHLKPALLEFLIWRELESERFRHLKKPLLTWALNERSDKQSLMEMAKKYALPTDLPPTPEAPNHQSPVTNHQSPVTNHHSPEGLYRHFQEESAWLDFQVRTGQDPQPFQSMLDAFEKYAAAERLKNAIAAKAFGQATGQALELFQIGELVAALENKGWHEELPVAFFYQAWQMGENLAQGEPHFQCLRQLLQENSHLLLPSDYLDLLNSLQNFCLQKVGGGDETYRAQLFEIIRQTLDVRVQGYVPYQVIVNAVNSACKRGEQAWARQLVKDISEKKLVGSEWQELLADYCLGIICFYEENYLKSRRHLEQVSARHAVIHYNARQLLVKALYEQGKTAPWHVQKNLLDDLKKELKSLKEKAVRDQETPEIKKSRYVHFVKFVIELFAQILVKKLDPAALERLRQELETNAFSDKNWLKKKLEQMMGGGSGWE